MQKRPLRTRCHAPRDVVPICSHPRALVRHPPHPTHVQSPFTSWFAVFRGGVNGVGSEGLTRDAARRRQFEVITLPAGVIVRRTIIKRNLGELQKLLVGEERGCEVGAYLVGTLRHRGRRASVGFSVCCQAEPM